MKILFHSWERAHYGILSIWSQTIKKSRQFRAYSRYKWQKRQLCTTIIIEISSRQKILYKLYFFVLFPARAIWKKTGMDFLKKKNRDGFPSLGQRGCKGAAIFHE